MEFAPLSSIFVFSTLFCVFEILFVALCKWKSQKETLADSLFTSGFHGASL
jgi:hypothetical protein